ncbi:OB-fold nucleic acid binding domain-containing protein [Planctomicrobium piriforme]|uniref:DUF5666 domain-containing protein n=1 Tax=Planctomicrobium piriforme TaxID=1576369 RepID=A0A1I3SR21_9PLAN|nr:OB-fold nucleic acid binding domain-containing protein [Planctomicrobium piriforme]SFJ59887.1 hypothetical protein SAMN05421753_1258 [Planctomicrobium piriforme]
MFLTKKPGAWVLLFSGLAVAWGLSPALQAQPRTEPAARPQMEGEEMLSGKVTELLKNDHDDVDGLLLDNGLQIHFPPHIGRKVVELVGKGDRVEVEGRKETLPRGEVVFEARRIESQGETIMVDRPAPPRGPKGKGRFEKPMNADGVISEMHENHRGDIDGFLLEDETEVKFPPHLSAELQELVQAGDEVRVEGRRHVTPHGDVHLHADRIIAVASGKTLERDEPGAGPGPRPAPPAKPSRDAGIDRDAGPTNAEIMKELRELRKLVERQEKQ